jgi:U3 small nucleolar RNA-associated protein 25
MWCRGIKNIVFYSLPLHGHFYSELVNMIEDSTVNRSQVAVEALFTEFDCLALNRIVGHNRCQHMLQEDAPSFLFT